MRETSGRQQISQRFAPMGLRLICAVAALDAVHRYAQMILRRASPVFETQLVFDGDQQQAARLEHRARALQHRQRGVCAGHELVRVLQHADQRDDIELRAAAELVEALGENLHRGQIARARAGDARAPRRALQRQHLRPALPQVAGDGAAARPDFQDLRARQPLLERPQDIGAAAAQVIQRRPVGNVLLQLIRQHAPVRGCGNQARQPLLHLISIAVCDAGEIGACPDTGLRVQHITGLFQKIFHRHQFTRSCASRLTRP